MSSARCLRRGKQPVPSLIPREASCMTRLGYGSPVLQLSLRRSEFWAWCSKKEPFQKTWLTFDKYLSFALQLRHFVKESCIPLWRILQCQDACGSFWHYPHNSCSSYLPSYIVPTPSISMGWTLQLSWKDFLCLALTVGLFSTVERHLTKHQGPNSQ